MDAVIVVRGDTAVVELAQATGLYRLTGTTLKPLQASSFGTGELILPRWMRAAARSFSGLGECQH